MNVIGISENNNLIFEFSNDNDSENLEYLKNNYLGFKDSVKQLPKKGVFYKYNEKDGVVYYFLVSETTNRKDAIYIAKNFLSVLKNAKTFREKEFQDFQILSDVIFHNTKNIQNQSLMKLKNFLDEDQLRFESNKIGYIKKIVEKDTTSTSRLLLSLLKDFSQIGFEYTIQEYLQPGTLLTKADFSTYKIHTIFVTTFYIYESQFEEKNIQVELAESQLELDVHFSSFRSAIVQLFDNALKYCREKSKIYVTYEKVKDLVIIDIEMTSLYIDDECNEKMFLKSWRGESAKKYKKGKGIGLYIAKKMLELNNSKIFVKRMSDRIEEKDGQRYSQNMFVIQYSLNGKN